MELLITIWSWVLDYLVIINLVLSVVIVFFQRRDPKAVWTWLLILYFIPVLGFFFYLVLAQDFRKNKMFRVKEVEDRLSYSAKTQEKLVRDMRLEANEPILRDYGDLILYNLETSGAVLALRNQVDIITDGTEKFTQMKEDMRKATSYIHIQYYIIKKDEVFLSFFPLLTEKVKQGVEVRILYDGMGGRFIPKRHWDMLRLSGIKIGCFFPPVLHQLNLRVNYRNHRKIVVIDGEIGYVGGFNIGREYLGIDEKIGYWRDTHLRIRGDAVVSLQIRFALDWNYATKENLFLNSIYFQGKPETGIKELLGIQIITSGPDSANRQIRDNYLELFHKAHHHIYIQTPYFVPDDTILSALKIAVQSGVEVRLMIPCKPDHPFVYWATYSYVGELVQIGAKCYTYENGFLHAKGVMIDSEVSCYGTANMDIRSFELNFEVNATIYDEETTIRLETIFKEDLIHCKEITKEVYEERSTIIKIKEQGSRLLSPLL